MWWRLMAPFIACLTSHVLPKCVNPPPPHESRAPLLMRCDVGWIYLKKLSSNRSCLCCDRARGRLRRTLTVPCLTRHGLCHHVTPPHAGQTHTQMMTWPDYVPHMWFPWGGGGCGSWGRLVLLVKVSRRSATPGPDGKCLVWGDGWLLNLASLWMFVQQTLTYCANNTWDSKIWRKGDYFELNCFILFSRQCNHV